MSHFVFALTNPEAEALLKKEIATDYPDFKLSYSRPGFLTFKSERPQKFSPKMCRLSGVCLGKKTEEELKHLKRLWAWKREEELELPTFLEELSRKTIFKVGEIVTLVMMIGPGEFWVGEYELRPTHFQTPGEVSSIEKKEVPSRAYYKLAEAFESYDLPFSPGERVLELGSAPGGASQFLLEQEMKVLGVDPAEMDKSILKDKNFTHLKRAFETITENDLNNVDWIVSDVNLPPTVVMKEVMRLLGFLKPKGIVITLKLNQDRYLSNLKPILTSLKEKDFLWADLKYLPSHRQEIALIARNS